MPSHTEQLRELKGLRYDLINYRRELLTCDSTQRIRTLKRLIISKTERAEKLEKMLGESVPKSLELF